MKNRKVKRKITKNMVIFSLMFIFSICLLLGAVIINSKKLVLKYEKIVDVSLGEQFYNIDNIISIKNGFLLTEKQKIDTTKLGQMEVSFEVKDFMKKIRKFKYTINVLDKESPVISCKKELETIKGNRIDLLKDVVVTDNSNEKIVPSIEGDYSFDKVGEYKLSYIAKDSSMNVAKEDFVLKVKDVVDSNNNITGGDSTFVTSKGFKGVVKGGLTYIDGYLVVNKTYTLPSNYGNGLTSETTSNFV